ncbi:zinc-ribbon domain-containing protein [Jannaschia sp. M317]|uniref:zinc-ribbon domain-containing protein n=1 Tax=Jannaschia sp. M317 TaxID=2867011 RepID=UPI0021A565F2|nr:zinc-ribbon domain-containing protein [Jannaschia sp. M317]UWQ17883.1 zinc-ribbon domain-containing protein [Jannaschia sp. M317]
MRLICPNCSAQYEVAVDMIPADGRDVQCSNCGTTWFQPPRGAEPVADPIEEIDEDDTPEEEVAAAPAAAPRRPLADQETLDILRQERAHEARRRAIERRRKSAGETSEEEQAPPAPEPEDRDPVEPDPRAAAAAERARMAAAASVARARDAVEPPREPEPTEPEVAPAPPKAEDRDEVQDAIALALRDAEVSHLDGDAPPMDDDVQVEASTTRASRRDLLPDIEEINSSLRPDERALEAEEAGIAAEETDPATSSGFRVGFLAIGALVLLLVGAYVFAQPIAAAVPALGDTLAGYVNWVDAQRIALEVSIDALTTRLLPPEG